MSKIALPRSSFTQLEEGDQILQIKYIEDNKAWKQLNVTLENKDGVKTIQHYSYDPEKSNGLKAFGYLCHQALENWDVEEIDTKDLKNKFIEATVVRNVVDSTREPGKTRVFINLKDIKPAIDFDHKKLTDDEQDVLDDEITDLAGELD